MAEAERWATTIPNPAHAIDDDTAIKVTDGTVEVVSEGHWKLLTPAPRQAERRLRSAGPVFAKCPVTRLLAARRSW